MLYRSNEDFYFSFLFYFCFVSFSFFPVALRPNADYGLLILEVSICFIANVLQFHFRLTFILLTWRILLIY